MREIQSAPQTPQAEPLRRKSVEEYRPRQAYAILAADGEDDEGGVADAGQWASPVGGRSPISPLLKRDAALSADVHRQPSAEGSFDGDTSASGRYQAICRRQRLPAKPLACKALQALDEEGEALPAEFSKQCYLGNREARAFFLALGESASKGYGGGANTAPDASQAEGGHRTLDSLRRLDLAGQGIANEAAWALAELLLLCKRLLVLDLRWNQISEKGAFQLVRAIEKHAALRQVHLEGNPAPSYLRVRLAAALAARSQAKT